jgi:Clp amino terminal domain, pathogenicity island component
VAQTAGRTRIRHSVSVADDSDADLPESLTLDEAFRSAFYLVLQYLDLEQKPREDISLLVEYLRTDRARWHDWQSAVRRAVIDGGPASSDHEGIQRDRPPWPDAAKKGYEPQRIREAVHRLSAQSQRVLTVRAPEEAGLAGHSFIDTGHLLLALVPDGDDTEGVLVALGVDLNRLRAEVISRFPPGSASQSGRLRPWTPQLTHAVESSLIEAEAQGHRSVEPHHLLLGLLAEGGWVAAQALGVVGVDPADARQRVSELP